MNIPSYPKVRNLGHPDIDGLLDGPITIQEKVDGSQFSFMWDESGTLWARSKGKMQAGPGIETDKMFQPAIDYLSGLASIDPQLERGPTIFRAEYMSKPKHNTIAYDEMPHNGLALFDVEYGQDRFQTDVALYAWAGALGISYVPEFANEHGSFVNMKALDNYLDRDSFLGGSKVEGIVIKNRTRFGADGKMLAGKYVSEAFKEAHKKDWKGRNPGGQDVVGQIVESVNTEARWEKAVQHLAEDGLLTHTPKDIGLLMKAVKDDAFNEEKHWMMAQVWNWSSPQIMRGLGRGLPEWYKQKLAERQFATQEESS